MEILNKIEFENNLWVGEVLPHFNYCQESRYHCADIGSISKGKFQSNNPEVRFNHFLTESGGEPSVPLEFIPVKLSRELITDLTFPLLSENEFINKVLRYTYINDDCLHTNLRTLLKAGIKLEDIPYNTLEEVKDFKIVVGQIPKFVYDHIVMHRAFSRISESSRNKRYLNEVEFFKEEIGDNQHKVSLLYDVETGYRTSEQATKELSCRRLVKFAIAGWVNDGSTFDNLFKVRSKGTGTQDITQTIVDNIKKLIYE